MPKFKLRELNRLTDAYSYTGDEYTLKITYDENDDKCIEIETNIMKNETQTWVLCAKDLPNEGEEVLLTFKNLVGLHVGEALFKCGSFYYIAETDNGYFEEPFGIPVAWMKKPNPYKL